MCACAQADVKDRIGVLEQRGRLLLQLPGEYAAAEDVFRCLCAPVQAPGPLYLGPRTSFI